MVMHTFGYYKSKNTTAEEEIDVIVDDVLTRTAQTRFMIPANLTKIVWGFAGGAYLGDARLLTPSLETKKYRLRIIPRNTTSDKPDTQTNLIFAPSPPVSLTATEELSFLATVTDTTSARDIVGIFTLAPDTLPPTPAGEPIWVRCTGNTTLSAYKWTTVKITPEVQLEAGTYALLKAIGYSANAIAVRFIIPGLVWRPGFPAVSGANEHTALSKADYVLEKIPETDYGRFTHLAIPEVQFLASSADSSEVVYMKLVKVA